MASEDGAEQHGSAGRQAREHARIGAALQLESCFVHGGDALLTASAALGDEETLGSKRHSLLYTRRFGAAMWPGMEMHSLQDLGPCCDPGAAFWHPCGCGSLATAVTPPHY